MGGGGNLINVRKIKNTNLNLRKCVFLGFYILTYVIVFIEETLKRLENHVFIGDTFMLNDATMESNLVSESLK